MCNLYTYILAQNNWKTMVPYVLQLHTKQFKNKERWKIYIGLRLWPRATRCVFRGSSDSRHPFDFWPWHNTLFSKFVGRWLEKNNRVKLRKCGKQTVIWQPILPHAHGVWWQPCKTQKLVPPMINFHEICLVTWGNHTQKLGPPSFGPPFGCQRNLFSWAIITLYVCLNSIHQSIGIYAQWHRQ